MHFEDPLFHLAPDAMLVFDDTGTILAANEQAGVLLGVPAGDIPGQNLGSFGPPGWDPAAGIRRLVAEGANRDEFRLSRADELIDVEYSSRANVLPGQHLTIIRDISNIKRREASLRASEELFARALLQAPAAMAVTGHRGAFLLVNERFLALTGYWRSEVIGRTADDLQLWLGDALGGTAPVQALRTKGGAVASVTVAAAPVEIAGGACTVLVVIESSSKTG